MDVLTDFAEMVRFESRYAIRAVSRGLRKHASRHTKALLARMSSFRTRRAEAVIREYRPDDREHVIGLWRAVFPAGAPRDEPGRTIDVKLAADDHLLMVAEVDGTVVGTAMAGFDGYRGWLYAVAVTPAHRRTGTGKRLVEECVDALRTLGCTKVNLQLKAPGSALVSFYESLGFAIDERLYMSQRLRPPTKT